MNRRTFLRTAAFAAAAAVLEPSILFAGEGPVVKTPKGAVRGAVIDGVHVFRGVPCGLPPYEGAHRLAVPEFVPAWNGTIDCFKNGSVPLQFNNATKSVLGGGDCLRLNIWTPGPGHSNCPVMVFIPGGGSTNCDNNDPRFDGTAFAKDGVILVTANYRVNVDGFLRINGVPANLALRDMMLALQWVQDNIAAFGGDPTRVTVFGQSAGATHITSLLASPMAKGLFKRAILQSPAALAQYKPETAAAVAAKLLEFYGIGSSRTEVMSLAPEKLLSFGKFIGKQNQDPEWCRMLGGNVAVFKPWYDGEVLQKRPADAIREGASKDVDLMAGCADAEWRWYTVPSGAIDKMGEKAVFGFIDSTGFAKDIADRYRAAGRGSTPGEIFTALQSDFIFRMPCNKIIENHAAAGGKTWAYAFSWKSDAANGRLGAAHSCDIPFVFKTLHQDNPRVKNTVGLNPPDALAEAMHSAWVRFAKTGDPGWKTFDAEARTAMRFDTESKETSDPWKIERKNMPLA